MCPALIALPLDHQMKIKYALWVALLGPTMASAATTHEVITAAAMSKMSSQVTVNGVEAEAVYVGEVSRCQSIALVRNGGKFIENFRVCDGEVRPRNTVSPAWDEEVGKRTLSSVVINALNHGQAQQQDENGYLISARTMGALNMNCRNIEVIVSYDGDFVDRGLRQICQK